MALVRTASTLGATTVAAGAAAAVWGFGIERNLFTVRHHQLEVLPAGSRPLRVLHLSDAHMAPWQHRKQQWMARLAELAPDFVVNTGDNLGHREGLKGLRAALEPLRGVPGVFVHGSNDHDAPAPRNWLRYFTGPSGRVPEPERLDTDVLDEYLTGLGWADLNNTATRLDASGVSIKAFGVSDAHREWDDLEAVAESLAKPALAASADLTLGVTHAPYRRVLDEFVALGADVLFAGHTHGGQVRIPVYGALVANCDIPLDQARGLSQWSATGLTVPLNVSAGLGHSIYAPVRFACRPEASLITLRPRPA